MVGEKVDVLKGGEWVREKLVVKVHSGPLYDIDVSEVGPLGKLSVIVLKEKGPHEVRAYGPAGSVVPRWSPAEIDALTVAQLRHALNVLSIPLAGLSGKVQLAARLKEAMPQAVDAAEATQQPSGSGAPPSSKRRRT